MDNRLFILVLIISITAFMALIVSTALKLSLVPKHPDTFKQTLKTGLLGGLLGMILFLVAWYLKKQETNSWETPGIIATIPIFTMLAGQLFGVYRLFPRKK